jgi:hypothetical protein
LPSQIRLPVSSKLETEFADALQTVFEPLLMQVNFVLPDLVVAPNLLHGAPAEIEAAFALGIAKPKTITKAKNFFIWVIL